MVVYLLCFMCIYTMLDDHWNVYLYADISNVETVLKEYDTNLVHQFTPNNMLSLVDATSLLWRLHVSEVYINIVP